MDVRLLLGLCAVTVTVTTASGGAVFAQGAGIRIAQAQTSVAAEEKGKAGTAVISGTVSSFEDEHPLAGASVVVINKSDESKRYEAETGVDGTFVIPNVVPGDYEITVNALDMLAESRTLTLASGETKSLKVQLNEVEAADVLRITGKRTLIHPENIGSTTRLDREFLNEYGSGNSLRQVIETTPGVLPDSLGNVVVRGEHNAINYEIDGVVIPESAGVLQQSQFATPRSLQSVQVDIGGYQARDGGGPLGAVAHMKSLPISPKPNFNVGGQIGGPIAGSINFYGSGAVSQDPKSPWYKLRYEVSGATVGTSLGLQPPTKAFRRNGRADMNYLGKLEYIASERDTFRLTAMLNESFLQVPTSPRSYRAGARYSQHDRQNLLILSYKHRFAKFFDEANLHILNGFYSERLNSRNIFDPDPIINGEEAAVNSVSANARRTNYVFGAQGDISKTVANTHKLTAGFFTEYRPVSTKFSAVYRNANVLASQQAQLEAFAEGSAVNPLPYGAIISPFTGLPGGPQMTGNIGKFHGSRFLQSAYFQDAWRPTTGILKRLTVDAGIRFDLYRGVFGSTMGIAQTLATIPGIEPFDLQPFKRKVVTNAQASGRFGGAFVVTKSTVLRGSLSQIFQPPPADVFVLPPNVAEGAVNGIFNGTIRPLQATRGYLVDTSVETQIGPRFVTRTNLYYKKLKNFGDSGVIDNTQLYNRLTLSNQEAYGVETRMELKPDREGYGFNGFVSNTVAVAKLRGSKSITGGIYESEEEAVLNDYPDHDRRYMLSSGLGYRGRNNVWILGDLQVFTGFKDSRDPVLFGPHPARGPVRTVLGLSAGYKVPPKIVEKNRLVPASVDVRIDNMLNQRLPINLGSPFQGTRYSLPIRVLAGVNWQVL